MPLPPLFQVKPAATVHEKKDFLGISRTLASPPPAQFGTSDRRQYTNILYGAELLVAAETKEYEVSYRPEVAVRGKSI